MTLHRRKGLRRDTEGARRFIENGWRSSAESLRSSSLLSRSAPKRRKPLRLSQPERDWVDALDKVRRERVCRNCGDAWAHIPGRRLEAAHTVGRVYDRPKPCALCHGEGLLPASLAPYLAGEPTRLLSVIECPVCDGHGSLTPDVLWVDPDDVIPLCGPATDTASCHGQQEAHRLDVMALLSPAEQLRVVEHERGIERARIRTAPSLYRVEQVGEAGL